MADAERPLFRIRKLPRDEPAPPSTPPAPEERPRPVYRQPPPAPAAAPPPAAAGDQPEPATGALFSSPAGVLSFLAAIAGAGLAAGAVCRRAPESAASAAGGEWWAEVEVPSETAAAYARTARGRPFELFAGRWLEVPLLEEPDAASRRTAAALDVRAWPTIDLADLLATLRLQPSRLASAPSLDVVIPGALGHWVLRRSTALGVTVRLRTARRHDLRGEDGLSGVLLVRLTAPGSRAGAGGTGEPALVPLSLVQALTSLPYALVGRSAGPAGGRLLVDVRYRPPLAETLLGGMIPEDEIWLLGGPELGAARLELVGEEIDGADLLSAPELPAASAPPTSEARLPRPLPVRLQPRHGHRHAADAVLLDDDELGWLQRFLMTRPEGDRTFLLAGAERHFVTAPGGLGAGIPLGVPLTRLGPGGLYLESGMGFHPPLPEAARRQVFALDDRSVVAVTADGAHRFPIDGLAPAWTLWVGEGPPVREEMAPRARSLLKALSRSLEKVLPEEPRRWRVKRREGDDGPWLLRQAQEAELRGDFVRAAELLEQAGELHLAGRLYERAAQAER